MNIKALTFGLFGLCVTAGLMMMWVGSDMEQIRKKEHDKLITQCNSWKASASSEKIPDKLISKCDRVGIKISSDAETEGEAITNKSSSASSTEQPLVGKVPMNASSIQKQIEEQEAAKSGQSNSSDQQSQNQQDMQRQQKAITPTTNTRPPVRKPINSSQSKDNTTSSNVERDAMRDPDSKSDEEIAAERLSEQSGTQEVPQ